MTVAWDHYRSFLAVARQGSLSSAARELGLTQPTLGRHVDELEKSLATPLFARSPHGLVPTPAALELVPYAEAMASAADALVRMASGEVAEPKGVVRVTASEVVGVEVLPAILTSFRERYPQIVIELAVSNRNQDLLRRDADIAVRMARPTQGSVIARRIGKVDIGLYAHKRYLKKHGAPAAPEELLRHTMIGFDRDTASLRNVSGVMPVTRELFALRSDSDHAQLAALRAGFGIAATHIGIAARDKNLVPVLADAVRFSLEMWLAMHEDIRMNRRVRLLFDHLAQELTGYVRSRDIAHESRSRS
jgi:DNA-binding transcriptional LysR family regulator